MLKADHIAFAGSVAAFIGIVSVRPFDKLGKEQAVKSSPPEKKILPTGLGFGESPRWHKGRLRFCNWGKQKIVAVDRKGKSEVMARL